MESVSQWTAKEGGCRLLCPAFTSYYSPEFLSIALLIGIGSLFPTEMSPQPSPLFPMFPKLQSAIIHPSIYCSPQAKQSPEAWRPPQKIKNVIVVYPDDDLEDGSRPRTGWMAIEGHFSHSLNPRRDGVYMFAKYSLRHKRARGEIKNKFHYFTQLEAIMNP